METQTESDPVTFGVSTKGRRTVIYRNFEYVKHRNNKNGEIYWRCKLYQSYKCKGHLKTLDDRIVSNKDQEHTHQGNIATSLPNNQRSRGMALWSSVLVPVSS